MAIALLALGLFLPGCALVPPLPQANLDEPGWHIRQGQVAWCFQRGAPEIAGELLLATKGPERVFAQLTKDPFPLMTAQRMQRKWEVSVPPRHKRYSGIGRPPKRLILLYLPGILDGHAPPRGWSFTRLPDNHWRLQNSRSGESLEGFVSP